jgi:hypothetical protein
LEVLDAWAVKIAEEVAPDEVDLAPVMAHAFVSGGKDKEELFRRQGGPVQGAFGPEYQARPSQRLPVCSRRRWDSLQSAPQLCPLNTAISEIVVLSLSP